MHGDDGEKRKSEDRKRKEKKVRTKWRKRMFRVLALAIAFAVGSVWGHSGFDLLYGDFMKTISVVTGIHIKISGEDFIPKDGNGKEVDVFLHDGTTYLPIRAVAEVLDKKVGWEGETKTVTIDEKKDSEAGISEDLEKTINEEMKTEEIQAEEMVASKQSALMLEYTGAPWSKELEEALKDVDFSAYGFDRENPTLIQDVNSLYVLANKANHFPESFVPIDLVAPKSTYAGGGDRNRMRKVAADALDALVYGASNAGYDIRNVSAYRSIAYQKILFNNYAARDGIAAANKYSSKPSFSEHHTGLCVDVSSPSMGFTLDQSYGNMAEGRWLRENAHKYGFVIRYPLNMEGITGYTYEPWHIRYFGIPLATYLYENKLTFEEFIALQVGKMPNEIRY